MRALLRVLRHSLPPRVIKYLHYTTIIQCKATLKPQETFGTKAAAHGVRHIPEPLRERSFSQWAQPTFRLPKSRQCRNPALLLKLVNDFDELKIDIHRALPLHRNWHGIETHAARSLDNQVGLPMFIRSLSDRSAEMILDCRIFDHPESGELFQMFIGKAFGEWQGKIVLAGTGTRELDNRIIHVPGAAHLIASKVDRKFRGQRLGWY